MTIQDASDQLEVLCVLDAPSLRTAIDMAKDALREADELGGLDRLRELVQAEREGRCFITPFVAMVEQSLMNGEMKPNKDQRFNGRYAVVYCKPQRWATPLIDVCGTPYNINEAEKRVQQLSKEAAEMEEEAQ
ncbi:hypothetical protein [Butyricicoccus pullicaecorum]|uniref:hypothetical protein n=1 Tax=Butyricicoccus pullicaecorum TaxID=501571 RepID=UPI003521924A